MLNFLVSKDNSFFELFEQSAQNIAAGAVALDDLMKSYPQGLNEKASALRDIEHKGDDITHKTVDLLNTTFVTPIDREDIHQLISKLDDVLDLMDGASRRLTLYEIEAVTPEAKAFAKQLVEATVILVEAVKCVRNMKDTVATKKYCLDIHTIENEGDLLLRQAMASLFKMKDPVLIIKWKDVYEDLETAIDKCEDVANIIEGIMMKYA